MSTVWLLSAALMGPGAPAFAQAPATVGPAEAQTQAQTPPAPAQHEHSQMTSSAWQFMQDGVVFGTFTDQTGLRAKRQFRSQNWWMLMAQRSAAGGTLTASAMFSLEPATVGDRGYDELFQLGESSYGPDFFGNRTLLANVDRQHPHDFLMHASVAWERPITDRFGIVLAGAPVGEAALGPVAFMHRASAAENPIAPLSHHTFDATHITMGVVTAGVTSGPWMIESSFFQGREPDENRWDIMDPGAFDSWSARLSFRSRGWLGQVSHGDIEKPERLENIDVRRTTGSISWTRVDGENFTSFSVIGGQNRRQFSTLRAFLVEATDHRGRLSLYGRFEAVDVESEHLFFPLVVHIPHPGELVDKVKVGTIGAVYDVLRVKGFTLGAGADMQFYSLTDRLEDFYGRPRTAHVFFRLRTPLPGMGRMFDMTMTSHPHGGM
jgi:hypothetical protein